MTGTHLSVIGVLTPQLATRKDVHPPMLLGAVIERGKVVVSEGLYGGYDVSSPSGLARTTWRYAHGRLVPVKTILLRDPRTQPYP